MSKHIDAILGLIDSVVERRHTCDCGKEYVLVPDTSLRAKIECGCGVRRDFNLAHD